MKNIFLLPTDKPSRLFEFGDSYHLHYKEQENFRNFNLYITSDGEIKEGDWFIHSSHGTTTLLKCKSINLKEITDNEGKTCWLEYSYKIILTTDQDLIKEGVQAIDDEFLERFIKNPSCEWIEVENDYLLWRNSEKKKLSDCYKIIIPKEKYKPNTCDVIFKTAAALKLYPEEWNWREKEAFIEGAKWQQERMLSEEDCYNILHNLMTDIKLQGVTINDDIDLKKWFKQFKKK